MAQNKMKSRSSSLSLRRSLILLCVVLSLVLDGVHTDFFVVFLKSSKVLTSLRELPLLHALSDVPVDKGTLGVHQIKLVVESRPGLGNGGGVGQHADCTLHFGQIASRNDRRWLIVDADLEASRTPVDELDRTLGLDGCYGSIYVLGNDVSAVEHAASHVLAVAWVTLDHLVGRLKASVGDFSNTQLLVVSLFSRDHWSVGDQREVDAGVGNQVGLELGQIHVEGAIKAKGSCDGRHNLPDQPIEVSVSGALNVQVSATDIVDCLVVDHEGTVRVLQSGVGGEDGVVRLHHGRRHLGGGVDGKLQLGFLAVVDRETLHEKRSKSRAGAASERMEDEETLQPCALVRQLADTVKDQVDYLLADRVVAARVVIRSIFLPRYQLLRVKQLPVGSRAHLVCEIIIMRTSLFRSF